MTSHSLMTNTFEYSLQIVNPKLTVPYWDFTIESSTLGGNTRDITEPQALSPLFREDWFGAADPEDHQVNTKPDSRTFVYRLFQNILVHWLYFIQDIFVLLSRFFDVRNLCSDVLAFLRKVYGDCDAQTDGRH